ncbi:GNAT family N-acetyltransferase [Paenibacillus chungangensis]|uniref:GNAT family N-acetyltransferase n=1 Tax=Paenibacillus chungangensis TaxID=696535 RepID=A0ABW3HQ71_9BACL
MNTFPVIYTERLTLRQLRPEDSMHLFHYFSRDEVTEFYDLESFTSIKQATDLIDSWNKRYETEQGIRWAISLKNEERVIGTCGYHNWAKEHSKAEIGYELTPEYWRQGIMTEAIAAILQYGFQSLQLNRIEAFIDPANISSRKLLLKAGLAEEGLLRDCFFEKGQFVDAVIFSILRREAVNRRH